MPAHIMRDSSGRILHYSAKEAPSNKRMKAILSQARQQGAKHVGLVAEFKQVEFYEKMNQIQTDRVIRAYRKGDTPEAMRARITGPESQHATDFVFRDVMQASGIEQVSGLKGFQINFIY